MKKLTLELDDKTFAWLEVLAVGLAKENLSSDDFKARIVDMHNDATNDFSSAINDLFVDVAESLATGVKRSGSWERSCLSSLTGYDGTYVSAMMDECIKSEAKDRGFDV